MKPEERPPKRDAFLAFLGEGCEEVLDILGRQLTDIFTVEGRIDCGVRAAAEVDGDQRECFVHRGEGMAETRDSAPLAECLVQRLPEHEAYVLDQMVRVALDVAGGVDAQVDQRVPGELLEHVIEHADPCRDLIAAQAVELEAKRDVRLACLSLDICPTVISQRLLRCL